MGSTAYQQAVGKRLRALRAQRGWSLSDAEAASRGRWAAVVLGSYERGDRGMTVQKLSDLAAFYGVRPADLLPGDEPEAARSAAGEFPAEMSLSRDGLGRHVLAAQGPHLTVTVLAVDWADAEAFAGLYVALRRARAAEAAA